MISGLKHFAFCRRRWALIHIEQLWCENALTQEGHYLHERVHDLHITGECDMVELHRDPNGVPIHGRTGLWRLYPVEYKHGKPDARGADELQLCAQAMCLEEMFVTEIPEGAVYYAELRRRAQIPLTPELRQRVRSALEEMHALLARGYTPHAKMTRACKSCSMAELCLPGLSGHGSAAEYVRRALEDAT